MCQNAYGQVVEVMPGRRMYLQASVRQRVRPPWQSSDELLDAQVPQRLMPEEIFACVVQVEAWIRIVRIASEMPRRPRGP